MNTTDATRIKLQLLELTKFAECLETYHTAYDLCWLVPSWKGRLGVPIVSRVLEIEYPTGMKDLKDRLIYTQDLEIHSKQFAKNIRDIKLSAYYSAMYRSMVLFLMLLEEPEAEGNKYSLKYVLNQLRDNEGDRMIKALGGNPDKTLPQLELLLYDLKNDHWCILQKKIRTPLVHGDLSAAMKLVSSPRVWTHFMKLLNGIGKAFQIISQDCFQEAYGYRGFTIGRWMQSRPTYPVWCFTGTFNSPQAKAFIELDISNISKPDQSITNIPNIDITPLNIGKLALVARSKYRKCLDLYYSAVNALFLASVFREQPDNYTLIELCPMPHEKMRMRHFYTHDLEKNGKVSQSETEAFRKRLQHAYLVHAISGICILMEMPEAKIVKSSIPQMLAHLKDGKLAQKTKLINPNMKDDLQNIQNMCEKLWETSGKTLKKQLRDKIVHGELHIQDAMIFGPELVNINLVKTINGIHKIMCAFSEKILQLPPGNIPHPTTYWQQSWGTEAKQKPLAFSMRQLNYYMIKNIPKAVLAKTLPVCKKPDSQVKEQA